MLTFLLVFALVILTAVLFVGWLCVRAVAWVVGLIFGIGRKPNPAPTSYTYRTAACARANCRATNPVQARFCHRCGSAIAVAATASGQAVRMRYVA